MSSIRSSNAHHRSHRAEAAKDQPTIGDIFKVDYSDPESYLEAPPRRMIWYQPGGEGVSFRLTTAPNAPFRLNDIIGIHKEDSPPAMPEGKRLMRLAAHAAVKGRRADAAHLYKVVSDDVRDTVWTTTGPRVRYEIGQMYSIARAPHMPDPPAGTAWEVMGPDAEDRTHVWAILKRVPL